MLNNFFTLKNICEYLNHRFRDYEIHEIFTQEKSHLIISLEKNSSMGFLEYSTEKELPYLVYRENFGRAKKNVVNILEECRDKTIKDFTLKNNDRMISINFYDYSENHEQLIISFIPSALNCFYVENEIIKNSYKEKDTYAGKTFDEIFQKRNRANEVSETVSDLLKKEFNIYGKEIHYELLMNLNLKKDQVLNDDVIIKIENEFNLINRRLSDPKYILYENDSDVKISLLELERFKDHEKKYFDDINILMLAFISSKKRKEKYQSLKEIKFKEKKIEIEKVQKQIEGLKKNLMNCENAGDLRKKGEMIISNLHMINKNDNEFSAHDETGNEIVIKLNTGLSPAENAEQYFQKYKKQKGSLNLLKNKIEKLYKIKETLENDLKKINSMDEKKVIIKPEKSGRTKAEKDKQDETSKFRKFILNEKFEVWVGKDSISNDLLTTKHTAQNDLWFHVRGASGSHTVLKVHNKNENIDKKIILKAASIAAYYSKARNASNVPVAYCEKKFVRKKKGMKAGSVIMEREKVIFVKPGLPDDQS